MKLIGCIDAISSLFSFSNSSVGNTIKSSGTGAMVSQGTNKVTIVSTTIQHGTQINAAGTSTNLGGAHQIEA
ncbi:hypothetical protein PPL_06513 [Heterostelium album PN500]|uniref:Uncharacterized protein n=1 Tax=Heterostelium pallidum (strain ATCC 26659 / Pp 5 / PN500) TaxID=670386 RepID=D3BDD0_HETP5|nr:hypothetical protein PPL_06513 [Heterostelium album PN500]EFA80574.1 hypothetical protein PPL_06513 [Heterostelium album PN500]|eukprot:XP_020432694.1 hypothetical protein PPL_06513 [Heterostelium album PN500]